MIENEQKQGKHLVKQQASRSNLDSEDLPRSQARGDQRKRDDKRD
jgi:hypothetical protein